MHRILKLYLGKTFKGIYSGMAITYMGYAINVANGDKDSILLFIVHCLVIIGNVCCHDLARDVSI
ncbi:hypothetical protein [Virgibacillus dakarensis]|uniref:hypothetical protein n=1 Tax=Virgibacillus dakarensis TaxID=1917889 RepID=UPI001120DAFE|nr:hypothetical protein [Virgibacillus dakarensis]